MAKIFKADTESKGYQSSYLLFLRHNFWAGVTTVSKAFLQLSILKITTLCIGVGALGILGQASSCIVILQSFFFGGILNYLVTTLPKAKGNISHVNSVLGAVTFWALLATLLGAISCFVFSTELAIWIFSSQDYSWFFSYLAFSICLIAVLSVSNGILAAYQKIQQISYASLGALFAGVGMFFLFQKNFGLKGALIGLIAILFVQALTMFLSAISLSPRKLLEVRPKLNASALRSLSGFSIVMVVTGALGTLYQVVMRSYLTGHLNLSWADVGRWQALLKISEISMSFLGVSLLTSYLPQISEAGTIEHARLIVKSFASKVFLLSGTVCLILAIGAPWVLRLIYSEEFVELAPLLRLQLSGDFFRLSSWVFTYFFLAKMPLRFFLMFEIGSLGILSFTSIFLSAKYGVAGLIISQVAASTASCFASYLIYKKFLKNGKLWNRA